MKVALVTGSSRGIGRATAFAEIILNGTLQLALAKAGWEAIAVNYSSGAQDAEEAVKEIQSTTSAKAQAFKADLGNVDECAKLVADVVSAFGGLTLLVNNAGIMKLAPIADTDEALFDLHYKLNVKGPFFLAKAAIPHLQAGIGGVIFLSTSVTAATAVRPQYITYASNKGAIEQISRILAKDLGAKGIRVNTVSPGPVETQLFLSQSPAPAVEAAKQFSPFGRLGQPDEIADVIVYLASEQARWVSGQNIRVNGAFA